MNLPPIASPFAYAPILGDGTTPARSSAQQHCDGSSALQYRPPDPPSADTLLASLSGGTAGDEKEDARGI
jgi:hypothetical protein